MTAGSGECLALERMTEGQDAQGGSGQWGGEEHEDVPASQPPEEVTDHDGGNGRSHATQADHPADTGRSGAGRVDLGGIIWNRLMAELRISARVSMGVSWFDEKEPGETPPDIVSLVINENFGYRLCAHSSMRNMMVLKIPFEGIRVGMAVATPPPSPPHLRLRSVGRCRAILRP